MKNAILHTFNWKYTDIIQNIEKIAESGYGAILLPPPLYSDPNGSAWWQRYQPKDYRVLLSWLGGKKELDEIIKKCHACNPPVKVFVDLVINHMANEFREDHFDFPGKSELENYKKNAAFFEENRLYGDLSKSLFGYEHFNHFGDIVSYNNNEEVQNKSLGGLPDLNASEGVLEHHRNLMKAMHDMGFDGFRIDAVKHITERQLDNTADLDYLKDKFIFGEVLTVSHEDESTFMSPFLQSTHISAYDFMLFKTIREAFSPGGSLKSLMRPEQEGNALPWFRAVTFTVNHDLPLNEGFRGLMLEKQDEHLANAYILGKDGGVPLIYSDNNESAEQFPEDKDRWKNSHIRQDYVQMLKFHNSMHGENQFPLYENDNCIVIRRGSKGILAINKSGENHEAIFWTFGLTNPGIYVEQIHGAEMKLEGEIFKLQVPARTAQMWLLK